MADFGVSEILTALSVAASVAGTVVAATGQQQVGQGQAEAGQAQQQADVSNAAVQQQNSTIATQQAQAQAAVDKQQTELNLGQVAATYGAAGIDPTQGSPLSVFAAQASTGELNRQLDLYRGSVGGTSAANQANLLTYQGAQAATAGNIAATAANTAATGTILSGAARVAPSVSTLFPSVSSGNQDYSGGSTAPGDQSGASVGPTMY